MANAVGAETAARKLDADGGRFLHHLVARATGHEQPSLTDIPTRADDGADHFVQGVVTTDVFAHDLNSLARHDPRRSVNAACLGVDRLAFDRGHRVLRAIRASSPAASAARSTDCVSPLRSSRSPHKPQPVRPVVLRCRRSNAEKRAAAMPIRTSNAPSSRATASTELNFIRIGDHAFAQRESDSQVFEISGRSQHHDIRNAVIHERDRSFLCDAISRALDRAISPANDVHFMCYLAGRAASPARRGRSKVRCGGGERSGNF